MDNRPATQIRVDTESIAEVRRDILEGRIRPVVAHPVSREGMTMQRELDDSSAASFVDSLALVVFDPACEAVMISYYPG